MNAGAVRVGQAIVERVLAGQERDDTGARHVGAEIDDQVAKIVFFLRSNRAVGQKHEGSGAGQAPNRVIRVDPGIAAGRGLEFRPRRPQFRGDNTRVGSQLVDEILH